MRYRAAIFDLDGTLIDSDLLARTAMEGAFDSLHSPLTCSELAYMIGRSSRTLVPVFLAARGISNPDQCEAILSIYRTIHDGGLLRGLAKNGLIEIQKDSTGKVRIFPHERGQDSVKTAAKP
jgi:phosphoglycolate phosphatase-like HAD superfamily hydrolase